MLQSARVIGIDTRDEATQELATFVDVDSQGIWWVRVGAGEVIEAARAASCLVMPAAGDLVLVARSRREGAFVIAVLRRAMEEKGTILAVEGGLDIRLASGGLRVSAQDGVEFVSPAAVSLSGGSVKVNAVEGQVAVQGLSFVGTFVSAEIDRLKLVVSRVDSVLERVSERIKRSYRRVEELDHLHANRIDYTAEKTMSFHAEHALVTAKELVKMDGEQIHLG